MITRRNLLLGVAATGAGATAYNAGTVTVSRPGTAFGTTVNITVRAQSDAQANSAVDAAYAEIRHVHRAASLFDPKSEVSVLNASGMLAHPSHTLTEIVLASDQLNRLTDGAFDPTIQPLWKLWANGTPDQQTIGNALRHVGWYKFHSEVDRLSLDRGASLSFNGIAQGYAADCVMASLRSSGVFSAMIDTGEAGRLGGDGAVVIQHPRKPAALGSIKVRDGFVAVSGDYATTFSEDFAHHHIFDPKHGFSPQELASVAVAAPTGAMADGLATAFMVMGIGRSLACLSRLDGHSALFVDKAGAMTLSPGMKLLFQNT